MEELPPTIKTQQQHPKTCFCQWIKSTASISSLSSYLPFWNVGSSLTRQNQVQNDEYNNKNETETRDVEETIVYIQKDRFPTAFTSESLSIAREEKEMIQKLDQKCIEVIPDFQTRASSEQIRWGGPTQFYKSTSTLWYAPALAATTSATPLEQLNGGILYNSYLRIMKWPSDLHAYFPFKLCKKLGCDSTTAIQHTLQFREVYKPWMVTPKMKQVNSNGLIFQHGLSPGYMEDGLDERKEQSAGHGIVWLRPAVRVHVDEVTFTRTIVRELERAVAVSMNNSNGRVGKFNAVVDGKDFSFGCMPSINGLKSFVTISQDHYVDRLGVVILTNLGRFSEVLLKLFLSLITEEVRNKIIILPHDEYERRGVLETVLGKENVPLWLGGENDYRFNVDEYYNSHDTVVGTDEEAVEYLELMPYHAT
jgi:hypothetical protein